MQSIQNIFGATIKENKENKENKEDKNLSEIISELTFELSKKKIQRLKDDSHIQIRLGELFEMFNRVLESENQSNKNNIDAIINGLIKAASYDKEEFLYKSIYEKEQLEKSIYKQKENIKKTIIGTLDILETHILNMDGDVAKESLKALQDTKLRGVEMLGILRETTSEALLTTLEKAVDIEDTVFEITKNITYQTINEGDFSKSRFLEITSSIIEVAIEIADEDQGNAKNLLNGTIHGTKEGMAKAIDKFKNDLKFAPDEAMQQDLHSIKKELIGIENDFVELVKKTKNISKGISLKIINSLLEDDIDSSLSKVKRVAVEARETLTEKIDELQISENEFVKKASEKLESIKQDERTKNITKEAKRLGNHAWEVAKGALKGAKEAINRQK